MNRPQKAKVNAKGRNATNSERFVRLPHTLLGSPAYRSLRPNSRALLTELIAIYNGANNGDIGLSEADAAQRMGLSCRKAASAAFDDLIVVGFIRMASDAYFHVKTGERRARRWRLTWLFDNTGRKPPSKEWQQYQPQIQSPKIRSARGKNALMTRNPKVMGADNALMKTSFNAKVPFLDEVIRVENAQVIDSTRGDDARLPSSAWWQCECEGQLVALQTALASLGYRPMAVAA